jgi:hypothetical protein
MWRLGCNGFSLFQSDEISGLLQGCHDANQYDTLSHCTTNAGSEVWSSFSGTHIAMGNAMGMMAGPAHPPFHELEALMTYLKPKVAKLSKDFLDHY